MIKISAVILTLNEEKNIGRCIQSVQDLADEVIVVDSYSTDRTREICSQYGVSFHQHKFEGHVEQKNYALSLAEHNWVLSLDADEALSEELSQSIREVKSNPTADGYYFNRLNNFCGQWIYHCGWYPDRKLRLFNKQKARWGGENPHDMIIMSPGSKTTFLKGDLLHYSFYTITQHIDQINKFSSIKAQGAFLKKKKSSFFKIHFYPAFRFFRAYILKGGFRDGYYGWIISKNSAFSEYLKYCKLKQLWEQAENKYSQ